jgi:hypothetical protein
MPYKDAEWARLLYRELEKTAGHHIWIDREKVLALGLLLEKCFAELTKQEQIAFSTLFARISYVGHARQLSEEVLSNLQYFRRTVQRTRQGAGSGSVDWKAGLQALGGLIHALSEMAPPTALSALFPASNTKQTANIQMGNLPALRVVAVADREKEQYLLAFAEEEPGIPLHVRYGLPDRNDNFTPSIQAIRKVFGFPVTLQLLDVDFDDAQTCRPRGFVIEPDYLLDVSAVSECFKDYGAEPLYHAVKKFLPYEVTPAILLGNIANHFLDRLLHEPEADFETLFKETFALYPFVYAPMTDAEVRALAIKARKHYFCLRQMAAAGFARQGIEAASAVVEPSFYSARYGLQGRLDLFYREKNQAAIVELKSGQPFRANSYGIARSHFTQTLLYDLLARSVYGNTLHPAKYILYSGADEQPLRFAPTVEAEQWEALQVRNQILAVERLLANIVAGTDVVSLFERLRSAPFAGKGFLGRDMGRFETAYRALRPFERKYVAAFAGFIAREHWLAKCGVEGNDQILGHAALWRMTGTEKELSFSILAGLELVGNHADAADPILLFRKTAASNPLANFRVGDIAVLYPVETPNDTVLAHQVIKCSIVSLERDSVRVSLRFRQSNLKLFDHQGLWVLEPDLLDSGYVNLYRNLFEWMEAPVAVRDRVLDPGCWDGATTNGATTRVATTTDAFGKPVGAALVAAPDMAAPDMAAPDMAAPDMAAPDMAALDMTALDMTALDMTADGYAPPPTLTSEQAGLLQKMIVQQGCFLLWGPPGTGKTSVMLRSYVQWALDNTNDNLLLMAYTNRAVDEMCEALESIGSHMRSHYWRIGSRFGTAERFQEQLLSRQVTKADTRADLLETLRSRRIVLSTVASFAQNSALLALHPFQRLVVDEASQLLEPQLLGLLTHFRTAVLIGDHRQLPAVVSQNTETTRINDPDLEKIGLLDMRDSYFERLYRRCRALGLHDHLGLLSRQGRMHADLMDFPNRHFYDGALLTLNELPTHPQYLPPPQDAWPVKLPPLPEGLHLFQPSQLGCRRVLFLDTPPEPGPPGAKTSRREATWVSWLVSYFQEWYRVQGKPWVPGQSLGIITPWRAQIAQIRQTLLEADMDPDAFTIDTVERYQGGARDVIIVSCCVHNSQQMQSLVSLSTEGIDRKLNVALTRAREHVVVLGNASVLSTDERYRSFIDFCRLVG